MTVRPADKAVHRHRRGTTWLRRATIRKQGGPIVALALIALMTATGCGGDATTASSQHQSSGTPSEPEPSSGPSTPTAAKNEARLRRIATTTPMPLYYLGAAFHGWPLQDVIIFSDGTEAVGDNSLDPGQTLSVGYGGSCSGGTCGPKVEVDIQAADAVGLAYAEGCSRLRPVRGVPTVEFQMAGNVILFTGDLAISVISMPDVKVAEEAAATLRRVGEDGPNASPLPPPPAAKIPLIDKGCGRNPGEHGPKRSL